MACAERAHRAREERGLSTAAHEWAWERLAESNAASHDVLVELLAPQPGETFLDVGTGAGGVALRAARRGAAATAIDIADTAIEQARELAASEALDVQFDVGDAEALPYDDAAFYVVASAYGVNFAARHGVAARELARVCRPGGRLGLTLMPIGSRAAELWTLVRRYRADGDHPASWGTEERVRELLGEWFELDVRMRKSPPEPERDPDEAWQFMRTSFGPLKSLAGSLPADEVAGLRGDFLALRARYAGQPLTSVVVLGRRR